MTKRLLALTLVTGALLAPGAGAASAAPKSDPANCVGQVISYHTSNGAAYGPALVAAAKAWCRDGIPFHPPA